MKVVPTGSVMKTRELIYSGVSKRIQPTETGDVILCVSEDTSSSPTQIPLEMHMCLTEVQVTHRYQH